MDEDSVLRDVEVRLSGNVFRGDSNISDDVVFRRYGVLFNQGFVTKRSSEKGKFSNKNVWVLLGGCKLLPEDGAEERNVRVLKSSHTVVSMLYGKSKRSLFSFRIQWPLNSETLPGKSLLLGFEDQQTAQQWHTAFREVIEHLREEAALNPLEKKAVRREMRKRATGEQRQAVEHPVSLGASPESSYAGTHGHMLRQRIGGSEEHKREESSSPRLRGSHSRDSSWACVAAVIDENDSDHSSARETSLSDILESYAESNNSNPAGMTPRHWGRHMLVNGLPIYKQASATAHQLAPGLDSYMVSHRIRGSPRHVMQNLKVLQGGAGSCFWAFSSITDIQELPGKDRITVFKATMPAPKAQSLFLAPRDFFLQRLIRREEDGTWVMLLQSVDPEAYGLSLTRGHVEGTIASMGFTVAPLKPEFRASGGAAKSPVARSHESLVTLVLSANFGGCLSKGANKLYVIPYLYDWVHSWVEELLKTVLALQNKVDQDCFVRGEHDIAEGAYGLPADPAETRDAPARKVTTLQEARSLFSTAYASQQESMGGAKSLQGLSSTPTLGLTSSVVDGEPMLDTWLDRSYYDCPGTAGFKVRGPNYLQDKKKIPSEEPVFKLAGIELCKAQQPVYHVSRYLPIVRRSTAPFSFVLCFTLPYGGAIMHLVLVFEAEHVLTALSPDDDEEDADYTKLSPFELNMARFLADKGPLRNAKIKLIPSLAEGSWVVRQAVGQTPVMLGKRLKTEYFMEDGYFEADVDISANSTAARVTSMVAGAIKTLVFDIGILLESQQTDELPERLLGTARLNHLPLSAAVELDTSKEIKPAERRKPAGFDAMGKSGDDSVGR